MRQIGYELKKTVLGRGFAGMLLLLLAVSAFLGFVLAEKPPYDVDAVERIAEEYRQDPQSVLARYQALREAYEAYAGSPDADGSAEAPEWRVEFEQYRLAFEQINRQQSYIDKLDRTIGELEKQRSAGNAVNEMLLAVYERNRTLRLGQADMYGLESLFEVLSALLFPLLLFGAFLGSTAAFSDRERGNELLFRSARYGRRRRFLAKTVVCAVCCAVASVSSAVLSVAVYAVSSGFSAFTAFLQNSEAFYLFPLPLTVSEAVGVLSTFLFLACFFVCMVACVVGKYSGNRVFSLVGASVVVAAQYAGKIGNPHVAGSLWNIGSFASLCDGNTLFAHIYPVVMGGTVLYGMVVVSFLYLLCALALCAVFVLHRNRPAEYKALRVAIPRKTRCRTRVRSVSAYERQKQLFANKILPVLVVAVLLKLYVSAQMYGFTPTYTEQKYRSYLTSIEGDYTAEKQEALDGELSELYAVMGQKEEMERKYRAGEVTSSEMGAYLVRFYEAEQNEKALVRVRERLAYLRSQVEDGKRPSVLYDTGWNRLFAVRVDVVLGLLLIASMCGLFGDEYRNRMYLLYAVCDRKALRKAKLAFCIGFSAVCAFAFSAIDAAMIAGYASLPLLTARASGIEGVAFLDPLPLFVCALLRVAATCVSACGFSLGVAAFSRVTKSKALAFLLSSAVLFVGSLLL